MRRRVRPAGPAQATVRATRSTATRVAIIDFGSQYSQLIARRVREAHVYCELLPHDVSSERVARAEAHAASSCSGGPASVYDAGRAADPDFVLESGLPILGICYGMQLLAHQLGGRGRAEQQARVRAGDAPTRRRRRRRSSGTARELRRLDEPRRQGHGDAGGLPTSRDQRQLAGGGDGRRSGPDRHPVPPRGRPHAARPRDHQELRLPRSAAARAPGRPGTTSTATVSDIPSQVGAGRVICALSGGVDSAVAASLIHRAVGDQLTCVFVDNGLLRREEARADGRDLRQAPRISICGRVDAADRFLGRLNGVDRPRREAQDRRRRVHQRLRRGGAQARATSTSWPRARSIPT